MTTTAQIQKAIAAGMCTVDDIADYLSTDYDDCFDAILTGIETGEINCDDVVCPEGE